MCTTAAVLHHQLQAHLESRSLVRLKELLLEAHRQGLSQVRLQKNAFLHFVPLKRISCSSGVFRMISARLS
jgi:hypothetical protein